MKKSELRQIIREEANKILVPRRSKEERRKNRRSKKVSPSSLVIGKEYSVYEPGIGDWHDNLEYLGYDPNNNHHLFRDSRNLSPGSNEVYIITVFNTDVEDEVSDLS